MFQGLIEQIRGEGRKRYPIYIYDKRLEIDEFRVVEFLYEILINLHNIKTIESNDTKIEDIKKKIEDIKKELEDKYGINNPNPNDVLTYIQSGQMVHAEQMNRVIKINKYYNKIIYFQNENTILVEEINQPYIYKTDEYNAQIAKRAAPRRLH